MPKDNANTFSRQMQAFVTIPLKYFSQLVFKPKDHHSDISQF